jgi:hypothetical protein
MARILAMKVMKIKCVVWFSLQSLSETFLIPRRISPDITINTLKSTCKVPAVFVGI